MTDSVSRRPTKTAPRIAPLAKLPLFHALDGRRVIVAGDTDGSRWKAELLSAEKRGKEVFYRTSPAGAELCEAYRAIRQACFLDGLPRTDISGEELRKIAAQLRAMSGQYDQASRAAASL